MAFICFVIVVVSYALCIWLETVFIYCLYFDWMLCDGVGVVFAVWFLFELCSLICYLLVMGDYLVFTWCYSVRAVFVFCCFVYFCCCLLVAVWNVGCYAYWWFGWFCFCVNSVVMRY